VYHKQSFLVVKVPTTFPSPFRCILQLLLRMPNTTHSKLISAHYCECNKHREIIANYNNVEHTRIVVFSLNKRKRYVHDLAFILTIAMTLRNTANNLISSVCKLTINNLIYLIICTLIHAASFQQTAQCNPEHSICQCSQNSLIKLINYLKIN
jgi:hypothetical protein